MVGGLSLLAWRAGRITARDLAAAGGLLVMLLVAMSWAAYGFRFLPSEAPGWRFALHELPQVRSAVPTLAGTAAWLDSMRLLPNALTQGFVLGQSLVQERTAFLAGAYSTTGWWYYFPVALLLKVPLAVLAFTILGAIVVIRQRRAHALPITPYLLGPPLLFLLVAMTTSYNIGLRHILPVMPFLVIIAAFGAVRAWSWANTRSRQAVIVLLVLFGVVEVGRAMPDQLSFMNALGGGPRGGVHMLVDSNLDWGQSLGRLAAWARARGVSHVNLAYFGTAVPSYYGLSVTPIWGTTIPGLRPDQIGPPQLPGYVAVSATLLQGVPFQPQLRDFYKPLRDRTPDAYIDGSIRVYWVDRPWWTP
jgi:hypothetical protein